MPFLAIIIPVLDDKEPLEALLDDLTRQSFQDFEVVIANGGEPFTLAKRPFPVKQVSTPKGRGAQMNAGARGGDSPYLLFLHADSRLCSLSMLERALSKLQKHPGFAGHFSLFFHDAIKGPGAFDYLAAKSRTHRQRTVNGDQGLMIERSYFETLGGFSEELPFLEDQIFNEKLFSDKKFLIFDDALGTSARRFHVEGFRARYTLMALIMAMHHIGLKEFFQRAPEVYREQKDASELDLRPFLKLIQRLYREKGPFVAFKLWIQVGGYICQEAWQLFFLADYLFLKKGISFARKRPFLASFDRVLKYTLIPPIAPACLAMIAYGYFMIYLLHFSRKPIDKGVAFGADR